MRHFLSLTTLSILLVLSPGVQAQHSLKDGTSLTWDKEIIVAGDSLRNDSVTVPAHTVPVFEASTSQVTGLLKTVLPGATFKKQGQLLKATGVHFASTGSPMDVLARVTHEKKLKRSALSLAFLQPGTSTPVENAALQPAVRDLGVQLNKAVVQQ